jgi:hypothetical protein
MENVTQPATTLAAQPVPTIPPNISELRKRLADLDLILANPQPNLVTWQIRYWRCVESLMEFFGVSVK